MKIKRTIAAVLCLIMMLALAACGKSSGTAAPDKEETPEYIYTAEFKPIGTFKGYPSTRFFTENGYYATCEEKVGENIPEGVVPEYEGQYDVYASVIYFVGFDGKAEKLSGYKYIEPMQNEEDLKDFYSGGYLNGLLPMENGTLIAIDNTYASWSEAPEEVTQDDMNYWDYNKYEQSYYIRHLDADGTELSCARVELDDDQYLNGYSAQLDPDGNLVCGMDDKICAYNLEGELEYTIDIGNYVDGLVKLSDGFIYALYWDEEGEKLAVIDTDAGALGTGLPLPNDAYNIIPGGGDYDFYYSSGTNFFGYSIESEKAEKLFNWLNCDINNDSMDRVTVLENGNILGVLGNYDSDSESYTCDLVTVSKVPYDSVPHKETLTLAGLYIDYDTRDAIVKFNRSSDTCRIEIKDYSEYNTEEDYSAGLTKLTTEIMAGNLPDIIDLNELPYKQFAAKGLLEDLYPYLDSDSELDRDDFFPNILKAREVDGKLYSVVPSFYLNTVIGASSIVGDTPGWTYDDFDAALASMPEGCDPFDVYVTRDEILNTCLALDIDEYLDWTTGKCSFDSEGFVQLLKFANRFPAEYNWDEYDYEYENTEDRIAEGRQMLMQTGIWSFDDINYNEFYFGGDCTYIGYPTVSGVGNMIGFNLNYGMSSKCEHKDEAWQFLRMFFTEEYQKDMWYMPSNVNVFNQMLEKAMTPEYQKDANGNYVLDENGNRIEVSRGGMSTNMGEMVQFYALTQKQADKLTDLITTTTKVANYSNDDISNIVTDEAAAYFAGSKSAEDVAKLIQNKASLYVNEQR